MQLYRIPALIFALVMTFSLAACNGESDEITPETTESVETTAEVIDLDLHIVADGASDYTGVRPEVSTNAEIEALKAIRNLIKEKYGITIKMDTDGKRMPGTDPEYQILIGRTDEPESAEAVAFIESLEKGKAAFVIEAHEKRLVIVATNVSMYEAALKYLEETFMTDAEMTVPEGFRYTADAVG